MEQRLRRHLWPIFFATIATFPGVYLHLSGLHAQMVHGPQAWLVALLSGIAVLGASFLLLWACDAVQEDISQTLALAIVALIAVLPEYAVDMYITWQAAAQPEIYAPLAIANMTGANRLIIGAGWAVIVAIYWFKTRKEVRVGIEQRTELFFLLLATLYAAFVAIKGTLEWYDSIAFIAIYVWYIRVAGKRETSESEAEGPAELLVSLPTMQRRIATIAMFVVAAGAIAANAEQFAEGLIKSGELLNIDRALLIQWLAPIASEAPEFTVAIMFTLRLRANTALASLLSAKLNQWTLLVGMIPLVYGIASHSFASPIPMTHHQMNEIMTTAAQSLLAILMLASLRLTIGQASMLFVMFILQLIAPIVLAQHPNLSPFGLDPAQIHPLFSLLYIIAAITIFLEHPRRVYDLWKGTKVEQETLEL